MPPFEDDTVSLFSSCDTIDTFGTDDLASLGEEDVLVNDYSAMVLTVDDTTLTEDYDYQDYQEDYNDYEEEDEENVEVSAANCHPTNSTVASSSSSSSSSRHRRPSSRTFFREGVNNSTDVSPKRPRRSLSESPTDFIKVCTFASEEDLVRIHEVPCLLELLTTPEERSTIWYSSEEQQVTLMECIATVRALRQTTATIATNSNCASETSSIDRHHHHHHYHHRESLVLLQSKLLDEQEELTDRGLEFMTSVGFDISLNSRAAVQTVLQEQDRLRQELMKARKESEMEEAVGERTTSSSFSVLSPSDPERLSHVCRRTSAHRQRIAQLMGIRDARTVQDDNYYLNNSNNNGVSRMMESHSMHSSTSSSHGSSNSSSGKHPAHRKNLQRDGSLRHINPWAQPRQQPSKPSPSQLQRKSHQHRLPHASMTRSLHDSGGRARARQARREQSFSAARSRQSQETK